MVWHGVTVTMTMAMAGGCRRSTREGEMGGLDRDRMCLGIYRLEMHACMRACVCVDPQSILVPEILYL